ncbi:MAG: hypothetical protein LBF97_05385 [Elusimicrobiota bacterium]|nr:hypothetical protein [Elusimicrobiota bacterium]
MRDKLFLMDAKNRLHQDGNDFVRRVLEDLNYINNGGRYDYSIKQGEESKISAETINKAKEMASVLIPHIIKKSIAEISAVVSLVQEETPDPQKVEDSPPSGTSVAVDSGVTRPSSSYFNY